MNPSRFDVYHRNELYQHPTATFTMDEALTPDIVGWPDAYTLVASVECRNKERAYQLTQHIEGSWLDNPDARALTEKARSTSVGDIIVDPNDCVPWIVDEVGFQVVLDVRGRIFTLGVHDFDEVLFTASYEDVIAAIEAETDTLDPEQMRMLDWKKLLNASEDAVRHGDMFDQIQCVIREVILDALRGEMPCQ